MFFQIDFSCKRISLIEKGKISKSYDFSNLDQYDSEVTNPDKQLLRILLFNMFSKQ